jgi:hypothetical protein
MSRGSRSVDIDSEIIPVYGAGKDGAALGHPKVRGLNILGATLSSLLSAPVITSTRLRGGNADTRRGVTSFATKAFAISRDECGATGKLLVLMDSGFYVGKLIAGLVADEASSQSPFLERKPIREAIAAIPEAR